MGWGRVLWGLMAFGLLIAPSSAWAARSAVATTARTRAVLVTDTDRYAPGQAFRVALDLTPAPGWHTYWHDPGDAGAATTLAIAAPGILVGRMQWPLPQRLPDGPVMSFGYAQRVLLMRAVTVPGAGGVTLAANATWLVCKDICVPEHATFSLTLPAGTPNASADRAAMDAAAATEPRPSPWPARIAADGTLVVSGVRVAGPAVFLPDASDTTVLSAPQPGHRAGDQLRLKLTPTAAFQANAPLSGVLVIGQRGQQVGYRLVAQPGEAATDTGGAGVSLVTLLLAFAGGLVLNLMPCVFPVLAMKAVGLAALGGEGRRAVRVQAAAYTGGVIVSFIAIGVVLLGLRAAGAAAGWGFQFQWPGFVVAMAWLFFGLGLNLSGAFAIGGGWVGAGQSLSARGGALGSFATGLLAVLVATPCTAPFMGAAVATAASAPAVQAMSVFVALGIGFSLPWTVLALVPRLAQLLPRPGAWMEWLRQALAFPMYGAALWLVWVLIREVGAVGVPEAGGGLLLIGVAVWALRVVKAGRGAGRRAGQALFVAALLGMVAILPFAARAPGAPAGPVADAGAFTPSRLRALRQRGRPVLVNMTAAWCVTCLVNERVAIAPALAQLRAHGVAYLTGDWTRKDPDVTAFLHDYGRDGVPLYVFFGAGLPLDARGEVLPQILTPGALTGLR